MVEGSNESSDWVKITRYLVWFMRRCGNGRRGQVDYFPDFEVLNSDGSLGVSVGLTPSYGLTNALDMESFPDGSGRILGIRSFNTIYLVYANGAVGPSLRIDAADTTGAEGSTAIAFHPGFAELGNPGYGKFYALAADTDAVGSPDFSSGGLETFSHTVLYEMTMSDISANSFAGTTKREVMRFHESNRIHNVGDIDFGVDGQLYISLGEDNIQSNAQNLSSVYGKILRIDPLGNNSANGKYGIPADNPFIGNALAAPEVYAYGFRNPHRINVDPVSGALYAADVGWLSIEEVDLVEPGANYGWPYKEGSFLTAPEALPDNPDPVSGLTLAQQLGLVDPLFEYDHTDGLAILGGAIYRGTAIPWLAGKYLAADWLTGDVWVGDPATGELGLLFPEGYVYDRFPGALVKSVEADQFGEVHLVGMSNTIVRLVASPGTQTMGDFNGDGRWDCQDIDALVAAVAGGGNDLDFDMTGDGVVDGNDIIDPREGWLVVGGASNPSITGGNAFLGGDGNLDGFVDISDFNIWNSGKLSTTAAWCAGDFNADGVIDVSDYNVWNSHRFGSSAALTVPETTTVRWLFLAWVLSSAGRRYGSQSRPVNRRR